MPNDRTPNAEHQLFFFVAVVFPRWAAAVKIVGGELAIQRRESVGKPAHVTAARPIFRIPFELLFEKSRSGRFFDSRFSGKVVVA